MSWKDLFQVMIDMRLDSNSVIRHVKCEFNKQTTSMDDKK